MPDLETQDFDQSRPKRERSVLHQRVLQSLKSLSVPGYEILVEEKKSRLDLPNQFFCEQRKESGQRKLSLCYVDSILHANRIARLLIEVVDKSPEWSSWDNGTGHQC